MENQEHNMIEDLKEMQVKIEKLIRETDCGGRIGGWRFPPGKVFSGFGGQGVRFLGFVDEGGFPHGRGVMFLPNGQTVAGKWDQGKYNMGEASGKFRPD